MTTTSKKALLDKIEAAARKAFPDMVVRRTRRQVDLRYDEAHRQPLLILKPYTPYRLGWSTNGNPNKVDSYVNVDNEWWTVSASPAIAVRRLKQRLVVVERRAAQTLERLNYEVTQ